MERKFFERVRPAARNPTERSRGRPDTSDQQVKAGNTVLRVDLNLQGTLERWFPKKQNSSSPESDEQKTLKPAQLGEHKQGCYTSEEPTNMDHNHMKRRKTRSLSSESLDCRIQAETIKLEKQPAEINKGEEGRPKGTRP